MSENKCAGVEFIFMRKPKRKYPKQTFEQVNESILFELKVLNHRHTVAMAAWSAMERSRDRWKRFAFRLNKTLNTLRKMQHLEKYKINERLISEELI
jgi:hypothetical protein